MESFEEASPQAQDNRRAYAELQRAFVGTPQERIFIIQQVARSRRPDIAARIGMDSTPPENPNLTPHEEGLVRQLLEFVARGDP